MTDAAIMTYFNGNVFGDINDLFFTDRPMTAAAIMTYFNGNVFGDINDLLFTEMYLAT